MAGTQINELAKLFHSLWTLLLTTCLTSPLFSEWEHSYAWKCRKQLLFCCYCWGLRRHINYYKTKNQIVTVGQYSLLYCPIHFCLTGKRTHSPNIVVIFRYNIAFDLDPWVRYQNYENDTRPHLGLVLGNLTECKNKTLLTDMMNLLQTKNSKTRVVQIL